MATKTRPARVIQFAEIEQRFQLSSYWFGSTWCPAVDRKGEGYQIRVLVGEYRHGADTTTKWDYFYLDAEGTITAAPRGYARDYRPGRIPVEELDQAVAKYAEAVSR